MARDRHKGTPFDITMCPEPYRATVNPRFLQSSYRAKVRNTRELRHRLALATFRRKTPKSGPKDHLLARVARKRPLITRDFIPSRDREGAVLEGKAESCAGKQLARDFNFSHVRFACV